MRMPKKTRLMIAELKSRAARIVEDIGRQAADMRFDDRWRLFEEVRDRVDVRLGDMEDEAFERRRKREDARKARRG